MNEREFKEMADYYREQGAPQDQQMLIAFMREAQEANAGALSMEMIEGIAQAYEIRPAVLEALIRRVPGLRHERAPHRLEVCGTCKAGARLRAFIERTYGVKSGLSNEEAGFSYRVTPCMKNCKNGPSIRWDGQLYSRADEELIRALTEKKRNGAGPNR